MLRRDDVRPSAPLNPGPAFEAGDAQGAHRGMQDIREVEPTLVPGLVALLLIFGSIGGLIGMMVAVADPAAVGVGVPLCVVIFFCVFGLRVVPPNTAVVLQVCGRYVGTIKRAGWWWTNPVSWGREISLRLRNFESSRLKVNERDGSPVEIAAIIVWRVVDSVEAAYVVNDYENFVRVQSESAVRELASTVPYDSHNPAEVSLRSSGAEVAHRLKGEIEKRLSRAGIEVVDARISHLAYAPEIASAMLQRQQAQAIVAARTTIVEGAVSIVQMALTELHTRGVATLDGPQKASLVSNLLTVLCSERPAQPVVSI